MEGSLSQLDDLVNMQKEEQDKESLEFIQSEIQEVQEQLKEIQNTALQILVIYLNINSIIEFQRKV